MSNSQNSQNNDISAQESATGTNNQDTKYLIAQTTKDISELPKKNSPLIATSHLSKVP